MTQKPESGLLVEHQRFLRKRSPTTLQINVLADSTQGSELTFHIERFEQVKHAVLERGGTITVVPRYVTWAAAPAQGSPQQAPASHGSCGGS